MSMILLFSTGGIIHHPICRTPLHEECPKHHEHKGDPGAIEHKDLWRHWWEGPSDPIVGEGPGVGNASHPQRPGVTSVTPWAMRSSWRANSRVLKNTSIGGVS